MWPGMPTEFLHHVARNETVGGWVWRSGVARGGGGPRAQALEGAPAQLVGRNFSSKSSIYHQCYHLNGSVVQPVCVLSKHTFYVENAIENLVVTDFVLCYFFFLGIT